MTRTEAATSEQVQMHGLVLFEGTRPLMLASVSEDARSPQIGCLGARAPHSSAVEEAICHRDGGWRTGAIVSISLALKLYAHWVVGSRCKFEQWHWVFVAWLHYFRFGCASGIKSQEAC